jgi:hypothetical protein
MFWPKEKSWKKNRKEQNKSMYLGSDSSNTPNLGNPCPFENFLPSSVKGRICSCISKGPTSTGTLRVYIW